MMKTSLIGFRVLDRIAFLKMSILLIKNLEMHNMYFSCEIF